VKYDGRKKKSLDLNSIIEKPIILLKNLAINGKEVGKSSIDIVGAKDKTRIAAVQNKNKTKKLIRFTKVAREEFTKA